MVMLHSNLAAFAPTCGCLNSSILHLLSVGFSFFWGVSKQQLLYLGNKTGTFTGTLNKIDYKWLQQMTCLFK